jgi:hypothetical protein
MERYFFEDFRVKVSNVEKKWSGYFNWAANRVWEQEAVALTTEFEKLGLRVVKTLIRSFESGSKHWRKSLF